MHWMRQLACTGSVCIASAACVGGNPAIFEPGTRRSRDMVTVTGVVREHCLAVKPVSGHSARLVTPKGIVLAENTTGPDGSFTLRAPYSGRELYLVVGDAGARLNTDRTVYSRAGKYTADVAVECGSRSAAPTEKGVAPEESPARLPPEHLRPRGG